MASVNSFLQRLESSLLEIQDQGLLKSERVFKTPQQVAVEIAGANLLNFCSNNYLGLANNEEVIYAAKEALDKYGFGMASVRFIAGTQEQHLTLEREISNLLGTQETILFPSCFDANGGVFEALLDENDAIISDSLNHASLIDGIRLCKARRFRYANRDMNDLETQLETAQGARSILIATDGVFSMDGYLAPLDEICNLAKRFGALVMVDDSHATGFIGTFGAGTPEYFGVREEVDILSGTLGKALGGASGGYISSRHSQVIDLLRQKARPYLFSNSVPPAVVAGAIKALEVLESNPHLALRTMENAQLFRGLMTENGFEILPGDHPIVPVMFSDEHVAIAMAKALFDRGIYAVAFSYPVVPMGKARIRIQLSAAHTKDNIHACVSAFIEARSSLA